MLSLKTFHFGLWVTVIYILWVVETCQWRCRECVKQTQWTHEHPLHCRNHTSVVQTARTLHQQITLFTLLARQKEEDLCIPISDCTVFYLGSIFSINILSKWLLSASQYLITALQTLPLQRNIFQQNENLQRLCEPNNLIRNYPETSEGSPTKEKPENRLKIRISPVLFLIYSGDF